MILKLILALTLFTLGFLVGGVIIELKVVEVIRVVKVDQPVVVIQEKVSYIDRPFIVDNVVYVETPVYKPQPMRHFTTIAELKSWLRKDDTDKIKWERFGGVDCDEFAFALQAAGYADGYLISVEWTTLRGQLHVQNSVLIGNEVYLVEPQNDSVKYFNYLD